MTIEELTEIAATFLRENYGMELGIPILRNNRLRVTMGRFLYTRKGGAECIEIAGFTFEYGAWETVVDTLYHECVHYALFERGEPHNDGQPRFEAELERLGVGATGTNRVGPYTIYKCEHCGISGKARGRRLLTEYPFRVTRCCRAEIIIVGERIYNGTEAV